MARAAHALHEAGIVHQDIAPENVLLAEDGGRLADLGLAKVLQPGVTVTSIGSRSIGAVEYVDPAMLAGGQPSRLTDVYSLGITLHRALTGLGMFGDIPSDQPMMAMRAVLAGSPKADPSLGPEESALIKACVDQDLSHRPRTALEVAERIDALPVPEGTSRCIRSRQAEYPQMLIPVTGGIGCREDDCCAAACRARRRHRRRRRPGPASGGAGHPGAGRDRRRRSARAFCAPDGSLDRPALGKIVFADPRRFEG